MTVQQQYVAKMAELADYKAKQHRRYEHHLEEIKIWYKEQQNKCLHKNIGGFLYAVCEDCGYVWD